MPKPTVAILGATTDRNKFGNKSVRAHASQGYDVYPINPGGEAVEGLTGYRQITDIPVARLDRVSVYLRPSITLTVLDEIAAKGCDELWLNPGTHDAAVEQKARELGLNAILACSIVDLGVTPHDFGP